jgi:mRNA interferase MazF
MKRGTVVWVDLSDAHPPEMGKVRPAVVISNAVLNSRLNTLVVAPLSTQSGEIWPLRIKVAAGGRQPSYAVVPALRQVSKARLRDEIAVLPTRDLARLEQAVREYLSD